VFSHTGILLHCGGVQIPKPKKRNGVLEIENRTEFEKSKPTQPYKTARFSIMNGLVTTINGTYVLSRFPNVWSSLFTVKIAAQGTFVSFSITTLQ